MEGTVGTKSCANAPLLDQTGMVPWTGEGGTMSERTQSLSRDVYRCAGEAAQGWGTRSFGVER